MRGYLMAEIQRCHCRIAELMTRAEFAASGGPMWRDRYAAEQYLNQAIEVEAKLQDLFVQLDGLAQ